MIGLLEHSLFLRFHALWSKNGIQRFFSQLSFHPRSDILDAIEEAWLSGFPQDATAAKSSAVRTCQWLYRNMVMDATGRVLPCCAAPKPDADLVFDIFTTHADTDSFNSAKYRAARLYFADPAAYKDIGGDVRAELHPHCAKCEWNQDVAHTDGEQSDQYFKTLPKGLLSSDVRKLLHWQ